MIKVKLLIGLIVMLFSDNLFSQSFEGVITFENTYKGKSKNVNGNQLNALMGTKQEYYIKNSNYASLFNGIFVKKQIYLSKEDKGYTITGQSDTAYWEDYKINKDSMLSHQIILNKDTVLGIPCDLLVVQSQNSKTYYYFNSNNLIIDPSNFKGHNYGNWYNVILITKSIPLKTIYENEHFQMISITTKIDKLSVDDSIFTLPDKTKVAAAKW